MVGVVDYFFLERALELVGVFEQVFYRAKLRNKFGRRLFTYAGATGHVVRRIAFEGQEVYYLARRRYAVAFAHLLWAAYFEALSLDGRAVHKHAVGHQLAVVFVGGHHIGGEAPVECAARQRADYVVGLVALDLDHGYAVGREYGLDIGERQCYVFGLLVAPGLVFGVLLVAESVAVRRVEAYGYIAGVLFLEEVFEGVHEAEYGRGVEARRCRARRAEQGIVCPVNQGIGIE